MADGTAIAQLRKMVNEPTTDTYTDEQLSDLIDAAAGNLNVVAVEVWQQKAASYAELTDVQEGNSIRKMSNLYSQALKMAGYYATSGEPTPLPGATRVSRTRCIERV